MGMIFPLLVRLTPPLIIINNLTIVNLFVLQSHTRGAILLRMGLVGILAGMKASGSDQFLPGQASVHPLAGKVRQSNSQPSRRAETLMNRHCDKWPGSCIMVLWREKFCITLGG